MVLTLRTLDKQGAGIIGLASGARKPSSVVSVTSSKCESVVTCFLDSWSRGQGDAADVQHPYGEKECLEKNRRYFQGALTPDVQGHRFEERRRFRNGSCDYVKGQFMMYEHLQRRNALDMHLFGADDLVRETGSGYECPASMSADCCCIYEVPFMLSKR